MNKDRIAGKTKDIAGRVERQAGEWTGDTDMQIKGVAKQVEGKVQNTVGKIKDSAKESSPKSPDTEDTQEIDTRPHNRRSA